MVYGIMVYIYKTKLKIIMLLLQNEVYEINKTNRQKAAVIYVCMYHVVSIFIFIQNEDLLIYFELKTEHIKKKRNK